MEFTKGQRVTITRGNFRGETATVHTVVTSQHGGDTLYILDTDRELTTRTPMVKANSLKAL